jgi:hypothetical protein
MGRVIEAGVHQYSKWTSEQEARRFHSANHSSVTHSGKGCGSKVDIYLHQRDRGALRSMESWGEGFECMAQGRPMLK